MFPSVTRLDICRVCGSDDWLDLYSFGDQPLANAFEPPEGVELPAFPLDLLVCRNCWLVAIRHVIDPGELFSDYIYATSRSDLIAGHMGELVRRARERYGLSTGDLVVEFGSNDGRQLSLFRDAGMRVHGVDPARNQVAAANASGIPSLVAFFGAAAARTVRGSAGEARLVLGRQCLAHINDVHDVLDGVDSLLAADGVLMVEVPYLLDLLNENQFDTIFHEHLSYYSVGTLQRLLEAHDLELVDVERAPVHGGSIVIAAARRGSWPARASVGRILDLERAHGLDTEEPYRAFGARIGETVTAIRGTVLDLVSAGHRVAGYGAPSKGCALLQFCGLTGEHLAFVTDTTPAKQGTLTPGTWVPVVSPEQARLDPPDFYLLLAWNYAEEIIRKERELGTAAPFIVPVPTPRLVFDDFDPSGAPV